MQAAARRSSAAASAKLLLQQQRMFSHSKPVSLERARQFRAKQVQTPGAKLFAPAPTADAVVAASRLSASEICKARFELAQQKQEPANKALLALAQQECAKLSAEELTQTLYSFFQFENCEAQRFEVLREIFGRNANEFTADELVQVLQLTSECAPDRPVQNVRLAFTQELAKRSPKSFSTSSLVFLLPHSVARFSKLARELATRKDMTKEELVKVHIANAARDEALALHTTKALLLSTTGNLLDDLASLSFAQLTKFRFTEPSPASQRLWEEIDARLGEASKEDVDSLVRLLPFSTKAMHHDKAARLVSDEYLKASHDNVALVLASLSRAEYNLECAVWQRIVEALEAEPCLFLPLDKQLFALRHVNKFASKPVKQAFLAKSLFANTGAAEGGEILPWQKRVDYAALSVEDLKEIETALKSVNPASAQVLLPAIEAEIKSRN